VTTDGRADGRTGAFSAEPQGTRWNVGNASVRLTICGTPALPVRPSAHPSVRPPDRLPA
jgi:hypothetical protein